MAARTAGDDYYALSGKQRKALTRKVYELKGNRCVICGLPIIFDAERSLEHIKARKNGGKTTMDNLAPAHLSCNSAKGARDLTTTKIINGLPFFLR